MAEPHHKIEKDTTCGIQGCKELAERSINSKRIEAAGMELTNPEEKNVHLCKKHYREFKKKTKTDRELERLGW